MFNELLYSVEFLILGRNNLPLIVSFIGKMLNIICI